MIVSASRRTDVPAFYADWLMGRIEAGYCLARNPFDARKSRRVSLDPGDVDFMVLWTRDPRPLAPRLREIEGRGIRFYVQMTLAAYPGAVEPGALAEGEAIDALRDIADRLGPARTVWRYDPILLAEGIDASFHLRAFDRLSRALEGSSSRVALSVIDEYAATRSRLAAAGFPGASFEIADYLPLLSELAAMARSRGMVPLSCAEPADLRGRGIEAGACVDAALAASLWPELAAGCPRGPTAAAAATAITEATAATAREGELDFGDEQAPAAHPTGRPRKDPGQRAACLCAKSVDIGAYGTCPRGCAYCYANRGRGRLESRGPEDESL
jgi:hypothetical protein